MLRVAVVLVALSALALTTAPALADHNSSCPSYGGYSNYTTPYQSSYGYGGYSPYDYGSYSPYGVYGRTSPYSYGYNPYRSYRYDSHHDHGHAGHSGTHFGIDGGRFSLHFGF